MPHRRSALRRGIAVAAVTVLLGISAAGATARHEPASAAPVVGGLRAARPSTAVPSVDAPAMSPEIVRARVDAVLARQAAALTHGDLNAFLAPTDPAMHDAMRRRYDSVRALRPVGFTARVADDPVPDGERWRVMVELDFCVAAAGCGAAPTLIPTTWTVDHGSARWVEYAQSIGYGPRPWETSDLRATVGQRVVVAAPARYAGRLASISQTAEKAAARADEYARWHEKPSRYVVYLAGPEEWSNWYSVRQPAWAVGFTMPITPEHSEVVLNAGRVDGEELLSALTHEFTHVSTLGGVQRSYTDSWLLVEGIAEYVTHSAERVSAYRWLSGTRQYVRSGRWTGTAALAAPAGSATVSDASGRYGVAYLAVRRLAERYGEDKMLAFFAAVARDGRDPAVAAPEIFGAPWTAVAADCDAYIRGSVA
jgi:hypothetical protein